LILLLLDHWPLERINFLKFIQQRRQFWKLVLEKFPFFLLACLSSIITFLVQRSGGAVIAINIFALKSRLANASLSYFRYIGDLFCPKNMSAFYPFDINSLHLAYIIPAVFLFAGISVFVVCFGSNRKYLPVGWFWFLITLLPVIGIIQVGEQSHADRYTYIPYIGLFIIIAFGMTELLSKWKFGKITFLLTACMSLAAMAPITYSQIGCWENSFTLFTHAIEVDPNNCSAYNNIGAAYDHLAIYNKAIEFYDKVLKIKPDFAQAHYNRGVALAKLRKYPEAIQAFKTAIALQPTYAEALCNLAIAYNNMDLWLDAVDACQKSIKIKPDFAEAYYNLGLAYGCLDHHDDAIQAFNQAIKLKPDYAQAYYTLGVAYNDLKRWSDAIDAFKKAINIDPDFPEAYNNLGAALVRVQQSQQAIEYYKKAIQIKSDFADAHFNLGFAYLKTCQKDLSLEQYKILKNLNPEFAEKLLSLINANVRDGLK
jgi:protein O-mannosyl-transferase